MMTPTRLRDCMDLLAMSDGQIVRALNVHARLVRRWQSGERQIPADVEAWIERLVTFWQANPPPVMRGRPRDTD